LLRHAFRYTCVLTIAALVFALASLSVLTPPKQVRAATAPCAVQFGMYEANTPWNPAMTEIRALDTAVNRHSSIVHYYAQWGDPGSGVFSANQPWMLDAIRNYTSVGVTGSTPLITWEAWGPAPMTVANNTFPLSKIAAGTFDAYIDSWAVGLRTYGGPVMLDFGHEMDGDWYPWGYGVNGNTVAQYIAAFRHVHDRFVLAGATNVQFVWNPNVWNVAGVDQAVFYPGDAYVDWLAIDVYNWGTAGGGWGTLAYGLTVVQTYARVAALNSTKPMMLAEWGSVEAGAGDPLGVTKSQWIVDAATALGAQFPRITAAIWFNASGTTWALDSSAGSMAGARTAFGGCPAVNPSPSPVPSPSPSPVPSPSPSPLPSPSPSPLPSASPSPLPSPSPSPLPSPSPSPLPSPSPSPLPSPSPSPLPSPSPSPLPSPPPGPSLTTASIGGFATSGPAITYRSAGRIDVFARGSDNQLYQKSWNGTRWSGWIALGGFLTSDPAAISWGSERIDVFARGADNALYHKVWDGVRWSAWESLGGALASGAAVASWASGRLDVFARGTDSQLLHKAWTGKGWGKWEALGGFMTSDPAAVSWGPNRIDVFARGADNGLYHKSWNGSAWSGWEALGGALSSGPGVSSSGAGRMDVFVLGPGSALYRRAWNGSSWADWQSLGGSWTADPTSISQTSRIDIFERGSDNAIWHLTLS
jgi:beta-mannanase